MEVAEEKRDGRYWGPLLAPFETPDNPRAVLELTITLVPYLALWGLMVWSLNLGYWPLLLLAPLAGLFLMRLFILQHDCGHGSFFSSDRANRIVGSILGVMTFTPYAYWRRTHSLHHATSGNLDKREFGDIVTLTVEEYKASSPWEQLCYRIYRHPLFFLLVGSIGQFFVKHRYPSDIPKSWRREWRSVWWTNLALLTSIAALCASIGWKEFLLVQLPIVLVAAPLGIWFFFVQHQFEGAYWARQEEWDYYTAGLKGSSFYKLPAILNWFSANIGFHHIHHLSSAIPCYRLQDAFRAVPALQEVPRLTLLESLRCTRFKLWDEENRRLVGFEV